MTLVRLFVKTKLFTKQIALVQSWQTAPCSSWRIKRRAGLTRRSTKQRQPRPASLPRNCCAGAADSTKRKLQQESTTICVARFFYTTRSIELKANWSWDRRSVSGGGRSWSRSFIWKHRCRLLAASESRHRPSRPSKWRLSSTRWRPTTSWRTRSASIATCLPFPATMMTWKLRGHLRHFPLLGRPSVNVVDVRLIHTAFAQATIRRSWPKNAVHPIPSPLPKTTRTYKVWTVSSRHFIVIRDKSVNQLASYLTMFQPVNIFPPYHDCLLAEVSCCGCLFHFQSTGRDVTTTECVRLECEVCGLAQRLLVPGCAQRNT